MSETLFDRVALIGIGLIGSSLARVLRRDSPGTTIVACARRPETLAAACASSLPTRRPTTRPRRRRAPISW